MKSFLVILSEKQPALFTDELLMAHVNHLKELQQQGNLILCGPFVDNQRALLIIRASEKAEVEAFIEQDPFIKSNYYQQFELHEFMEANDENLWLGLIK